MLFIRACFVLGTTPMSLAFPFFPLINSLGLIFTNPYTFLLTLSILCFLGGLEGLRLFITFFSFFKKKNSLPFPLALNSAM